MTEAKSENTVNKGKTLFGTKASVDSGLSGGDSALVRPATHRVISIDTSGLDVTKSSFSPENRSAPVSPAVTSSRSRRNSWQVKSSSLRYSPKTVGTLEKADPLSPNLKAANLEFGRRKSFTVFTHSEWLKAQRLQKTSLSSDRTIRRISQGGSGVPVAENSSEKASSKGMSYIKATTKKRSMTMDDASTLEHIIREAKMRSSPEFYTEDSNVAGLSASPPGLDESVNNSNFIEHPSGAFELFFVSGVHPNTHIDNPGHWQADIIFQYPSNDSHAFRSSALDSSNLSDFAFPEGVESFHVDNDDASIEQINLLQDRHYFTLTDASEVYHGFCLSVAHRCCMEINQRSNSCFWIRIIL